MPIASIEGGDLCKVWEIKTLGRDRDGDVKKLLEAVAKQVQPIMRKRKWTVRLLTEFCPSNPSLLGLNIGGGQEIRIRVRKPGREWELFPYEDLIGTMLHELAHNEHGPHDAKFYKLLDEVTKECEDLMAMGVSGTGQGFDGQGKRLGGASKPSLADHRKLALAAAEKRMRAGGLMPKGPRRVGGDSDIMKALSPVQAAAMAAERRLRDDLWCAAPAAIGANSMDNARENEVADSADRVIEENTKELKAVRNRQKLSEVGGQEVERVSAETSSSSSNNYQVSVSETNGSLWECGTCTLLNQLPAPICAACGSVRTKAKLESLQSWACRQCSLDNPITLDVCAACNQWRFSYGPPVSVRGPALGT